MLNMLQTMQKNQDASEQWKINILEQQRKDMEMRLEQQREDMDQTMEQQRKNMITNSERSMQTITNQVLLVMQKVFLGMGGVFIIALLQLQTPTSS